MYFYRAARDDSRIWKQRWKDRAGAYRDRQDESGKTEILERLLEIWMDALEEKWGEGLRKEIEQMDIHKLLCSFMSKPSWKEAEWFGSFLFLTM